MIPARCVECGVLIATNEEIKIVGTEIRLGKPQGHAFRHVVCPNLEARARRLYEARNKVGADMCPWDDLGATDRQFWWAVMAEFDRRAS